MKSIGFMALAALLLLSFIACQQPLSVFSSRSTDRGGEFEDFGPSPAPADPEDHFFFLPPLAPVPEYNGTFAFGLEPVVRVSLEAATGPTTLVEFSTGGSGSERVRLESCEELGDYYMVNFHLKRFDIAPHTHLLLEVLVEGRSIGALQAVVIANGSEKDVAEAAGRTPLVRNRTVPIKFRIEQELFVPPAGRIEAWISTSAPQELLAVPDYDDFIAVAAGSLHAVGLRADGSLVSWGRDTNGSVLNTPTGTGFVAVDAGFLYSMALHEDGAVHAWGGGLADSTEIPNGDGFTDIAAGYAFALAINSTGGLTGWSMISGMLDDMPTGTGYVDIKGGQHLAAVIGAGGQLELFGNSTTGVIGASTQPSGEYLSVDTGEYHAAGILSDGSLVSWGGTAASTYGLSLTLSDGPYIAVAAGERLGLGLRADGTLKPYGSSSTAASIPADVAEYFAVAVSPTDSAFAIRRITE